jgi:hypothetical protein
MKQPCPPYLLLLLLSKKEEEKELLPLKQPRFPLLLSKKEEEKMGGEEGWGGRGGVVSLLRP